MKKNIKISALSGKSLSVMSTVVFLYLSIGLLSPAFSQTKKEGEEVFEKVDKMPLFNNQEAGTFSVWIGKEIKYPDADKKSKVMGKVIVNFVVEKDGTVSNVKVLKSVSQTIDAEAIRVVKSSPKWTPGQKDNKPVNVSISIPIEFKLN